MLLGLVLLNLALAADVDTLVQQISRSGRIVEVAVPIEERIAQRDKVAPGAPPFLAFRMFDAQQTHRFGNLDLVMDDAGH